MKIVSWNTTGLGYKSKRMDLKKFLQNHQPHLLLIKETKEDFDIMFTNFLWSLKEIGSSFVESLGKSGGLLVLWDESKSSVIETLKGCYSLSLKCLTICKMMCWITNIHGLITREEGFFGLIAVIITVLYGALVYWRGF